VTAAISVFLADDDDRFRGVYRKLFDRTPGFRVAGEAADGETAARLVGALKPAVALLDVQMPGASGLEAVRRLLPDTTTKVIMLTTFDLDEYVYEALRAGASGFLLKDSPRADLIAAVRAAAAGNALLAPTVTRRLIEAFARRPPAAAPSPARLAALTAREREVLLRLARGGSNTEIAAALFVSEATVKTHVNRIFAKTGSRDRGQAVHYAYQHGYVDPPG
jgi:DNA-binding NarL/FixJ family response regulator